MPMSLHRDIVETAITRYTHTASFAPPEGSRDMTLHRNIQKPSMQKTANMVMMSTRRPMVASTEYGCTGHGSSLRVNVGYHRTDVENEVSSLDLPIETSQAHLA